jgi:hypothetical protein
MGIPINTEIQQIADRFLSTMYGDDSLPCQPPQHLDDPQDLRGEAYGGFPSKLEPINIAVVALD